MALKAIVDTLEEVAEPLREFYAVREDGKYMLSAEGAEEAYAAGIVKNRDDILAEKRELEKKLKAVTDVDVDEYNRMKQAEQDQQRKKDEEQGNYRNLEKQLVDRHAKEKEALTKRVDTLQTALHRELIDARLTTEITSQKGVAQLLLPVLRNSVQVVEDETTGEFVPTVVDPISGKARIGDTKGTPMTITQLVQEAKTNDVFSRAFEAEGGQGGGARQPTNGGGAGGVRLTRDQAKDPVVYRTAREEATKRGTTVQITE